LIHRPMSDESPSRPIEWMRRHPSARAPRRHARNGSCKRGAKMSRHNDQAAPRSLPCGANRRSPADSLLSPCWSAAWAAYELASAIGTSRRQGLCTGWTEGALVGANIGFVGWRERCAAALAHAPHL
jgi:hypothetical protein